MTTNAAKTNEIVEVTKELVMVLSEEGITNPKRNLIDYLLSEDPVHIMYHTKKNKEIKRKFVKFDRDEILSSLITKGLGL